MVKTWTSCGQGIFSKLVVRHRFSTSWLVVENRGILVVRSLEVRQEEMSLNEDKGLILRSTK
jgi:hypothetical protein